MKIILLIEDKPEEMAKAKLILSEKGCRFVSADNLDDAMRVWSKLGNKIYGILTDLHFPERIGEKETACGFAVVTRAVRMGIPVSICTDVNHHFCGYLKYFMEDIEMLTHQNVPYTMDNKNWQQAVQKLIEQFKED
ncbi:MAG: hypothetical protein WC848_02025 [Parcubacteria group bacterium]|jgi:hypothetical protein